MKEETIAALVGAAFGALAAWLISRSTNQIQKQIADCNIALQKEIADSNAKLQRDLATENTRVQQRGLIDQMLLKVAEWGMQYPTVEKHDYCSKYPNVPGDANGKERYEHFCTYLFNVLSLIFTHCDRKIEEVCKIVILDEIVGRHHRWWRADPDNRGYDDDFQAMIDECLRKLDKAGKLK